ncbi:MAG: DUF3160 domain-containing protein [Planctomycetes bacterium]|nr:DUF3160 domain-containing protein [Planctomycetota bacterium]
MTPACERLRPAVEALSEGDDLGDPALLAEAGAHLEACAACQEAAEATGALRRALDDVVPLPPPDVWRVFQDDLAQRLADVAPERRGLLVRLPWAAPLLALAAGLLVSLGALALQAVEPRVILGARGRLPLHSLEHRDPTWAPGGRSPAVDLAAVDGVDAAARALSPDALAALHAFGLVQVPSGSDRLADLYPLEPRPGDLPPVATADASLLLSGAVAARAALALEVEVLAPGLRDLLAHALVELRSLEVGTRDAAAKRAARRARELLGVAAVLAGVDPRLPPDARARVDAEVERLLAGAAYASPLLGREVDGRALAPRGLFAPAPELHGHARAVAWLGLAWLPLDAARPDDVRAAGLVALALAAGRGERRTALDLQARLEAAVEVLHGPPDDLTPLDLVEVLRQGLGASEVTPAALAAPGAVERVVERAAVVAAARQAGRVGPAGAPVFRLLGGARTLEGAALTRLSAPALPARPAPTSVDLLVVLGAPRARTVVSAMGLDAPGYDAAADALADEARAWTDAARPVPARASLEQARLWAAAALLERQADALPAAPGRYADRLLLAALAALNAPEPWPPAPGAGAGEGPIPLVEPLPRLHARLAFTAERLAQVLDDLAPPGPCPALARAVADLRRVARLEAALRDASLAALEARAPAPATVEALRDFAPTVHTLGPARAASAEDVFVERAPGGQARVLHRVVHALDRLLLVVVDPATGRPTLAAGAALAASERWTDGARLDPARAREGALDPPWAEHVVRR